MNKRRLLILLACLLVLAVVICLYFVSQKVEPPVTDANAQNVSALLSDLVRAYETPDEGDAARIEADLAVIGKLNRKDEALARSIAEHWQKTYLNPDYTLCLYKDGEETATVLLRAGIPDSATHAFVVLGFELADGEMQPELKGRCEAAAAAARAFPNTILVCSGGPTGANNPVGHTEAGLMKDYLVETCGIDAARIFIDEEAMTTAENAVNTFRILREQGVKTMTIVTSSYHQLWGQAVYQAMAARCERQEGYRVAIIGNYCYPIETDVAAFQTGERIAVMQMSSILELPNSAMRKLSP